MFGLSVALDIPSLQLAFASNCVHGRWEGDICVCDSGYETAVSSDTTEPNYCTEQTIVVIVLKGEKTWTHKDVIDLALPIVSFKNELFLYVTSHLSFFFNVVADISVYIGM